MRRAEFDNFRDAVYNKTIKELNDTKGKDYSGDGDAFANFKRNAARLGLGVKQVWAVYFFKHIDAIASFINTEEVNSEPIEGRIDDAITYLFLLRGMVYEREQDLIFTNEQNVPKPEMDSPDLGVKGKGKSKGKNQTPVWDEENQSWVWPDGYRVALADVEWAKNNA